MQKKQVGIIDGLFSLQKERSASNTQGQLHSTQNDTYQQHQLLLPQTHVPELWHDSVTAPTKTTARQREAKKEERIRYSTSTPVQWNKSQIHLKNKESLTSGNPFTVLQEVRTTSDQSLKWLQLTDSTVLLIDFWWQEQQPQRLKWSHA